jgi:uncharacterized membrane protein YccC
LPYWIVAVIILSFLPGSEKLRFGTSPYIPHHSVTWQHRWGHCFAFGITAILLLLGTGWRAAEIRAAATAMLFGLIIETSQYCTGLAAVFEWWDVRDDFIGIIVGVAVASLLLNLVESKPSRQHEQ